MSTSWVRGLTVSEDLPSGSSLLASIPAGSTLLRTRFGWGAYMDSDTAVDMLKYATDLVAFGLVTTVGNGSESVPDARTQAADQAPPTQRWTWWEGRALYQAAIDRAAGVIAWRDTGPQEPCDTKAQVKATGIPEGDTLNLWASWAFGYGLFDLQTNVRIWVSASVLYSTP